MPAASPIAVPPSQGEMLSVDMAELRVTSRLTDYLVAYGLGACLGVCLYEPSLKIAGMAHIVLPERRIYSAGNVSEIAAASPGKFVETAVPLLLEQLARSGGKRQNVRAAIAGGSQIFSGLKTGGTSGLEIGERNVAAVRKVLEGYGIPIFAADVGGSYGRTLVFRVSDGAVIVKPIGGQAHLLTMLCKAPAEVSQ